MQQKIYIPLVRELVVVSPFDFLAVISRKNLSPLYLELRISLKYVNITFQLIYDLAYSPFKYFAFEK